MKLLLLKSISIILIFKLVGCIPANKVKIGNVCEVSDLKKDDKCVSSKKIFSPTPDLKTYSNSVKAFPGAEGFGANSIGGRGGTVIKVTNLNDFGLGSFREAVTTDGPRIVVFNVSGIIDIDSDIIIDKPYITIAGESSPGGIMITGRRVAINTHDVIMRHMRIRVGNEKINYSRDDDGKLIYYDTYQSHFPPTNGSCIGSITTESNGYPCAIEGGVDPEVLDSFDIVGQKWMKNEAYNIIIDHCSFGWGVDETVTLTGGVTDTTVQWSIIAEGLSKAGHPKGQHSKGLMVAGYINKTTVSLHHNFFSHNTDRNPRMYGFETADVTVDLVNNITYNWYGGLTSQSVGYPKINWVYNYAKQGPESHTYSFEVNHQGYDWEPLPLLYVFGNIGSTRLKQSSAHWNIGVKYFNEALNPAWQKTEAWTVPSVHTAVMSNEIASCITRAVGAMTPYRDSVDARVLNDFDTSTGSIINMVTSADFPNYTNIPAPADTDNDGMPDFWELSHKLDNNTNDSAGDADGDGYTNIEEYLHYLSAKSYAYNSDCMPTNNVD